MPPTTESPTPVAATPPPLRDISYRVEEGDTLGTIAEQFGKTTEQVMEWNALTDETSIALAQILVIKEVDPALAGAAQVDNPSAESPIGFYMTLPLEGACITDDDGQMPNAPREYRFGIHEGVDFFTGFACIDVPIGQPVHAGYAGTVVRTDHEYRQLTQRQIDDLLALSAEQGYTDPGTLDKFRGRQVWIDHGGGIVTRYCHLSDIPSDVQTGTVVTEGQVIGFVGDSGTPESLGQEGYNKHLHFEIRVDNAFLGAGLSEAEARDLYRTVFRLR